MKPILTIDQLTVRFGTGPNVVDGVSLSIERGRMLALVGESGSGKSVTALSILQLLGDEADYVSGTIHLGDEQVVGQPEVVMRALRGDRVGMIFQEPLTSLNPLHTVERQIVEVLFTHRGMGRAAAHARVMELLELVGIDNPASRLGSFPHELSGGQRQRVMIAMALANEPDLLIADEPTTALDVTIAKQILELLDDLKNRLGMAILLITHDLPVVRRYADDVVVMRQGRHVESGPTAELFENAKHPYTQTLIDSQPQAGALNSPQAEVLLRGRDVKVWFPIKSGLLARTKGYLKAVDGVHLTLHRGETLGIVGESGSGKSTLAAALLRLIKSQGSIEFAGRAIDQLCQKQMRPIRKQMQIVFQDPFASLSPRMSVAQIIGEGLTIHGRLSAAQIDDAVAGILKEVGMPADAAQRYPHEFSGGQRQRIALARALVLRPALLVLDEPTSALDRTIQKQLLDILQQLQKKHNLSYIFISHDLAVIRAVSHRVMVMRRGQLVESGSVEQIFSKPQHSYTRHLLEAALY
jgi:microcin C transport system ATP-binding protein